MTYLSIRDPLYHDSGSSPKLPSSGDPPPLRLEPSQARVVSPQSCPLPGGTHGGVHVRRALVIRVGEHRDNGDEDCLHGMHGQPPLRGLLVAVGVISGLVQDRDAYVTILLDCTRGT